MISSDISKIRWFPLSRYFVQGLKFIDSGHGSPTCGSRDRESGSTKSMVCYIETTPERERARVDAPPVLSAWRHSPIWA